VEALPVVSPSVTGQGLSVKRPERRLVYGRGESARIGSVKELAG